MSKVVWTVLIVLAVVVFGTLVCFSNSNVKPAADSVQATEVIQPDVIQSTTDAVVMPIVDTVSVGDEAKTTTDATKPVDVPATPKVDK